MYQTMAGLKSVAQDCAFSVMTWNVSENHNAAKNGSFRPADSYEDIPQWLQELNKEINKANPSIVCLQVGCYQHVDV